MAEDNDTIEEETLGTDNPEKDTPEPEETKSEESTKESEEESTKEDQEDEDTTTEDEESEEESEDSDYNSYDHPALKQAVNILKEANLPVDEANAIFAEAVESGDISKIDKEALVEKLGEDKADIVLVLAESYYTTQFRQMQDVAKEAYDITGGKDTFEIMRTWAADKAKTDEAFASELAEIREMVDSGKPRAVKAAIRDLFDMYKADPNTTIEANLEVGDKTSSSVGVEPLSRAEYITAVEKAHRDGKYEAVRAHLWARRNAGIKKGI